MNKTKVASLNEICKKLNMPLSYDITQLNDSFHAKLTCGKIVTSGNGSSIKIANHSAADEMLKQFRSKLECDQHEIFKITTNVPICQITRLHSLMKSVSEQLTAREPLKHIEAYSESFYDNGEDCIFNRYKYTLGYAGEFGIGASSFKKTAKQLAASNLMNKLVLIKNIG